jgi:hypothetical protein
MRSMRWVSSVRIVTAQRAGRPNDQGSITGVGGDSLLLQRVQTSRGTHAVFYPKSVRVFSIEEMGVKPSIHLYLDPKLRCGTIFSSSTCLKEYGV